MTTSPPILRYRKALHAAWGYLLLSGVSAVSAVALMWPHFSDPFPAMFTSAWAWAPLWLGAYLAAKLGARRANRIVAELKEALDATCANDCSSKRAPHAE